MELVRYLNPSVMSHYSVTYHHQLTSRVNMNIRGFWSGWKWLKQFWAIDCSQAAFFINTTTSLIDCSIAYETFRYDFQANVWVSSVWFPYSRNKEYFHILLPQPWPTIMPNNKFAFRPTKVLREKCIDGSSLPANTSASLTFCCKVNHMDGVWGQGPLGDFAFPFFMRFQRSYFALFSHWSPFQYSLYDQFRESPLGNLYSNTSQHSHERNRARHKITAKQRRHIDSTILLIFWHTNNNNNNRLLDYIINKNDSTQPTW